MPVEKMFSVIENWTIQQTKIAPPRLWQLNSTAKIMAITAKFDPKIAKIGYFLTNNKEFVKSINDRNVIAERAWSERA